MLSGALSPHWKIRYTRRRKLFRDEFVKRVERAGKSKGKIFKTAKELDALLSRSIGTGMTNKVIRRC